MLLDNSHNLELMYDSYYYTDIDIVFSFGLRDKSRLAVQTVQCTDGTDKCGSGMYTTGMY